jgi:hypothetical protein
MKSVDLNGDNAKLIFDQFPSKQINWQCHVQHSSHRDIVVNRQIRFRIDLSRAPLQEPFALSAAAAAERARRLIVKEAIRKEYCRSSLRAFSARERYNL